jgi:hypothetical protein
MPENAMDAITLLKNDVDMRDLLIELACKEELLAAV